MIFVNGRCFCQVGTSSGAVTVTQSAEQEGESSAAKPAGARIAKPDAVAAMSFEHAAVGDHD
jgi:hypothetical protein